MRLVFSTLVWESALHVLDGLSEVERTRSEAQKTKLETYVASVMNLTHNHFEVAYPMKRHKGRRVSCPQLRLIEDIQDMNGEAYIMVNAVKYDDDEDWTKADQNIKFPVKFSARPQIDFVPATPTVYLKGYFRGTEIQAVIYKAEYLKRTGLEPLNHFGF